MTAPQPTPVQFVRRGTDRARYERLGENRTKNGEKWCSTCKDWWPVKCFNADRRMPDGRRNECKACRKERRVARGEYARDVARRLAKREVSS
jgi:hypothetical protein